MTSHVIKRMLTERIRVLSFTFISLQFWCDLSIG